MEHDEEIDSKTDDESTDFNIVWYTMCFWMLNSSHDIVSQLFLVGYVEFVGQAKEILEREFLLADYSSKSKRIVRVHNFLKYPEQA